jgi:hypothetical protein
MLTLSSQLQALIALSPMKCMFVSSLGSFMALYSWSSPLLTSQVFILFDRSMTVKAETRTWDLRDTKQIC